MIKYLKFGNFPNVVLRNIRNIFRKYTVYILKYQTYLVVIFGIVVIGGVFVYRFDINATDFCKKDVFPKQEAEFKDTECEKDLNKYDTSSLDSAGNLMRDAFRDKDFHREITILSDDYDYRWINGRLIVKEDNQILIDIPFEEKPLYIALHEPTKRIAIISSPNGLVGGEDRIHNLYYWDENVLNFIDNGGDQPGEDDFLFNYSLYDYWENQTNYVRNLNYRNYIDFSPDGNFIFYIKLGYEHSVPYMYNFNNLSISKLDFYPIDRFWKSDSKCFYAWNYVGRDEDFHKIGIKSSDSYEIIDLKKNGLVDSNDEVNDVHWTENCGGLVKITRNTFIPDEYQSITNEFILKFDAENGDFQEFSGDIPEPFGNSVNDEKIIMMVITD